MNVQRKPGPSAVRNESGLEIKPVYTADDVAASRLAEPEGGDGIGWGVEILLDDLEGAAQDGGRLLGLKDGDEIVVDGAALAFAYQRTRNVLPLAVLHALIDAL